MEHGVYSNRERRHLPACLCFPFREQCSFPSNRLLRLSLHRRPTVCLYCVRRSKINACQSYKHLCFSLILECMIEDKSVFDYDCLCFYDIERDVFVR